MEEYKIGDLVTVGYNGLWEVVKYHSRSDHYYCRKINGTDESKFKIGTTLPISVLFMRLVIRPHTNFRRKKVSFLYAKV